MGCPVGIGPEIILKYFSSCSYRPKSPVVVIGDIQILTTQANHFGLDVKCINWLPGSTVPQDAIPVYQASNINPDSLQWGKPNLETGQAMASFVETGVRLIQQKFLSGITTCPISKHSLQQAGYSYPGHTEMLAALNGDKDFTMMMAGKKLRVTLVTIHCGFSQIVDHLTADSILQRIKLTNISLQEDFAIARPCIAVAGLNPHAGEEGVFGSEEEKIISPAVARANSEGIDANGPFPPDTVFINAVNGRYDAVVCMYHDQGLIPFKLLHFSDGVNVTIGLSLVRTSVDHGTAYDIAGKGVASYESLNAALEMAAEIVANRRIKLE